MSTRRDYKTRPKNQPKNRPTNRRPAKRGAPAWLWMTTGVMAGLFVAMLIYLHRHSAPPEMTAQPPPEETSAPRPNTPPADAESGEPRYDFYTLLPKREVEISSEDLEPARERESKSLADGPWLLQAGSFRQYSQADALRAQLALNGFESSIDLTEGDNGVWHRVRLGPYTSKREVDRIRSKLARAQVRAIIIKASP